jgi:hypothetical protein
VWRLKVEGDRMMHPAAPKPIKEVPNGVHPGYVDAVAKPPDRPLLGGFVGAAARPRFRLVGYIEVPGDPERSKALLISDAGQRVSRSMTHCRWMDRDFIECEVDGEWVGTAGVSLVAHEVGVVPVAYPKGAQPSFAAPLGGGDAQASVASGAPAAVVVDNSPEHHLDNASGLGPDLRLPNRAAVAAIPAH